jgi:glycosyltransferase involved in cell wall biosynthesis
VPRPLVSIVIDNFNYGRFVAAAIESALAQSYRPLEVIVVDDGSTDDSRAIIRSYGERLRYVFQENQGQSGAFNSGYTACRGEIVLFLDSDDLLHPEAAAALVAAWRPGVAKLQFCLATIDAAGDLLGNIFPNYPAGLSPEAVRRETLRSALYPCPPTSGNAYGRFFLARVMPVPKVHAGADGPLNTLAPLYGEVVTLDRVLGYYRVHGANDGAQAALAADKFQRFIRHDQHRAELLREHARRLGIAISGDPLERAILHLQYRLASLRLLPEAHPVPGETVAGVVRRALAAAWGSEERLPARLAIIAWFLAAGLLPGAAARRLIAWRFVPASRPAALGALFRCLGVLRRNPDAAAPQATPAPGPTF